MSRGIVLGVACMLMASVIPVNSKPQPSEPFDYQAVLSKDDTYHLFWKFDEKNITFEVHVKSKGYVGFGLSPDGSMKGSDIVIGWVKDGKAYFQVGDYFVKKVHTHCHTYTHTYVYILNQWFYGRDLKGLKPSRCQIRNVCFVLLGFSPFDLIATCWTPLIETAHYKRCSITEQLILITPA